MRLAILGIVCEGELEIAFDAFASVVHSTQDVSIKFFLFDDGSKSDVGQKIAQKLKDEFQADVYLHKFEQSYGFRGSAKRLCFALQTIYQEKDSFDVLVRVDSDAKIARPDFGKFVSNLYSKSVNMNRGLAGEMYPMRKRDAVLLLADLLPIGFRRTTQNQIIQRTWELKRTSKVWWARAGQTALRNGFKFKFIPGCFWLLGIETLIAIKERGFLDAFQPDKHGFVFTDDIILTLFTYAAQEPVINLSENSKNWGRFCSIPPGTRYSEIKIQNPFIVHPLKNNAEAWALRKEIDIFELSQKRSES